MFKTTFLGHQGWLFSTESSNILVDPLLSETFGHRGAVGEVYPPRLLDLSQWPPLDAVFLTHEHEDHFDVPSLNRIDRRVPIYLSERSSAAAHDFVKEIGFKVEPWVAGTNIRVKDLIVTGFPANHMTQENADEWDVIPFCVRDVNGSGNFLSCVDLSPSTDNSLQSVIDRPGIWAWANNVTSIGSFRAEAQTSSRTAPLLSGMRLAHDHVRLFGNWGPPELTLFSGNGISYSGTREWMNRNVFPLDSQALASLLGALYPQHRFLVPIPGQVISMQNGKVVAINTSATFLQTSAEHKWPGRQYVGDVSLVESYEPASGRISYTRKDFEETIDRLKDFARYLYGTNLFRALYSIDPSKLNGKRPGCAFVLIGSDSSKPFVAEYKPTCCAFVPSDTTDPVYDYLAGLECWGSDLLDFLRGDLAPSAITSGRARSWNPLNMDILDLRLALWFYGHPLRRPENYSALYRSIYSAEPANVVKIRFNA